jgi:hypothetical protein
MLLAYVRLVAIIPPLRTPNPSPRRREHWRQRLGQVHPLLPFLMCVWYNLFRKPRQYSHIDHEDE